MNYEPIQNNSHESEVLTDDERKLSALLGNLKRVDAPKDFDFKLKARIAAASPADVRPTSFFPALRYVLPLCVVIMLSAFAALKIFAPAGDSSETVMAVNPPSAVTNEITSYAKEPEKPSVAAQETNANTVVNDGVLASRQTPKPPVGGKQTLVAALPSGKQTEKNQIKFSDNSNLNRVIAVRKGRVINMTPNATNSTSPNNAEQSGKLSIGDVLSAIGIEVEFVGANYKVKSVRESTAARIANFQPGDLIEAIDGKKLSSEMTFSEKFTGKIFNVVRDGKQIVIDLTKR